MCAQPFMNIHSKYLFKNKVVSCSMRLNLFLFLILAAHTNIKNVKSKLNKIECCDDSAAALFFTLGLQLDLVASSPQEFGQLSPKRT